MPFKDLSTLEFEFSKTKGQRTKLRFDLHKTLSKWGVEYQTHAGQTCMRARVESVAHAVVKHKLDFSANSAGIIELKSGAGGKTIKVQEYIEPQKPTHKAGKSTKYKRARKAQQHMRAINTNAMHAMRAMRAMRACVRACMAAPTTGQDLRLDTRQGDQDDAGSGRGFR